MFRVTCQKPSIHQFFFDRVNKVSLSICSCVVADDDFQSRSNLVQMLNNNSRHRNEKRARCREARQVRLRASYKEKRVD